MWPGTVAVVFLAWSFWAGRGFIQDHVRVVRHSDLALLTDERGPFKDRWERLPMLHQALPALKSGDYLRRSDGIAQMLAALGEL
jgi:hypothetical protein